MPPRARRGRILAVAIDQKSGHPLYRQIYGHVRHCILDGRLAPAYANRGYALFLQGKNAEAEKDFNRAVTMAPRLRAEIDANIKLISSWRK